MKIIFQRYFDIGMPQNLTQCFGIHPRHDAPCGERMAQRMEIQVSDVRLLQTFFIAVLHRARFHGTLAASEDVIESRIISRQRLYRSVQKLRYGNHPYGKHTLRL